MECAEVAPRRLRRGHSACGAETPRTELREQGYVCGGMPGQGRRAGLRAAQEPWFGPPGALASGQNKFSHFWQKTCKLKTCGNSTRRLFRLPDRRNAFSVAACGRRRSAAQMHRCSLISATFIFLHPVPVTNPRFWTPERGDDARLSGDHARAGRAGRDASDTSVSVNVSVLPHTPNTSLPLTYPARLSISSARPLARAPRRA